MNWHSTHKKNKRKKRLEGNKIKLSKLFALLNRRCKLNGYPFKRKGYSIYKKEDNSFELFSSVEMDNFVRPEKNDIFFKEPTDYNDLAVIGRFGDKNDFMIINGFYDIAINALKGLKNKDVGEKDSHIYPIIYNFRHYLELIMKQSIRYFRLNEDEIADDEIGYDTNHSLKKLWNTLKVYLGKIEDTDQHETIAFDKLINELDIIDRNSFVFRYHCNTGKKNDKIKLTIPNAKDISLNNLEKVIKKMHCYIEGISSLAYNTYENSRIYNG